MRTMDKTVKLFFRVDEAFAKRLDAVVETLPGDKSAVLRFAVERFVEQHEQTQAKLAELRKAEALANAN